MRAARAAIGDGGPGFVALSLSDDPKLNRKEARRMGLDWPLATSDRDFLGPLGVLGVPATVVIDDGRVVAVARGAVSERWITHQAAQLR